jgi:hypothetical protein
MRWTRKRLTRPLPSSHISYQGEACLARTEWTSNHQNALCSSGGFYCDFTLSQGRRNLLKWPHESHHAGR